MTIESAATQPRYPYANRLTLTGIITRRSEIFRAQGDRLTDEPLATLFKHYAGQCLAILTLLDEGNPEEAEKLLKDINLDPNLPERPQWSRGYARLYSHVCIAASTIKKLRQRNAA